MSRTPSTLPVPSSLAAYIREIEKYPQLSQEEERTLALAYYERGDREAAKKLVLSHLRYALHMAMKYQHLAPLMDLVQEANLGLMEAVKRFNPYHGFRLITYATYWIREHLQRYLEYHQSMVKRGTTRAERKVQRELPRLLREAAYKGEGEISLRELAHRLRVDPLTVQAVTQKRDVELDAMYGDDQDASLHNLITADEASPLEGMIVREEQDLLTRALVHFRSRLSPRDREIFETRILGKQPKQTLATLARRYGVSRERIRQIENRLRNRLKEEIRLALEGQGVAQLPPPPSLALPLSGTKMSEEDSEVELMGGEKKQL